MLREQIAHATFAVLADQPLGLTAPQVREAVKTSCSPLDHAAAADEWEDRFDRAFNSAFYRAQRAGWLVRAKGTWTVTATGRAAFDQFVEASDFARELERRYVLWRRWHPLVLLRMRRARHKRPAQPELNPRSESEVSNSPEVLPVVDPYSDTRFFRAPVDLAVSRTGARRVLIIGSCQMGWLADMIPVWEPTCQTDFLLFEHVAELPSDPLRDPSDYDFQVVQITLRNILIEHEYFHLSFSDQGAWERFFDECRERLVRFLRAAMVYSERTGLITFVTNFLVPQQNPMGRLLPRRDLRNLVYFVRRLNDELSEEVSRYPNAHVVDVDEIAADFGRKYIQDDVLWWVSHNSMIAEYDHPRDQGRIEPTLPIGRYYTITTQKFMEAVWSELLAMYRTLRGIDSVKLVVVDLDDTLWRGVVVEEDEVIAETIEGWPLGIVEALCFLKKRGILLAIVSKNDEAKIEAIWTRIFRNRILLSDFAVRKINWKPKVENLEEVLREVNLLPRSVVYVDDNPVERAAVKAAFPDVRVLGSHLYYLKRILQWSAETQVALVTEESSRRTEMVRAQVDRESLRSQASREEFLAQLQVKVQLSEINEQGHPKFARALELINKTNQFNTTGRRWTSDECSEYFASGGYFATFTVEDKFTAYGLVGVALLKPASGELCIDQFVMSCRVFGLDVELSVLSELMRRGQACGLNKIAGTVVPTDANAPSRDLYVRGGFSEDEGGERWVSDVERRVSVVAPHVAIS